MGYFKLIKKGAQDLHCRCHSLHMILFSLILSQVLIFKPLKALNLGFATLELQGNILIMMTIHSYIEIIWQAHCYDHKLTLPFSLYVHTQCSSRQLQKYQNSRNCSQGFQAAIKITKQGIFFGIRTLQRRYRLTLHCMHWSYLHMWAKWVTWVVIVVGLAARGKGTISNDIK